MLFKAMRLDKLSKGLSVNVEKRSRYALTLQSHNKEEKPEKENEKWSVRLLGKSEE